MRGARRVEVAEVDVPVMHLDLSEPLTHNLVPANAFEPTSIVGRSFRVREILRACCFAQIAPPIVGALPIFVVDLIFWPDAVHIKPCKSMSLVSDPVYCYPNVPVGFLAASDRASRRVFPWTHKPSE